jgi:small GTP-binding protein
MGGQEPQKTKKHICAGLLAHVDAGKTTLAESILYTSGQIRKLGRVDHRDAFLDTDEQERDRGITIFSKQAQLGWKDMDITLLDTPGHVDFSAEMERTLQVLDYAILVISASDGVQGHVLTLWKLLERYHVPVFLFLNKMDQPGADADRLLIQLKDKLDGRCVRFGEKDAAFYEEIAVCDEEVLEQYLETEMPIEDQVIAGLIRDRKLFPCYTGSALRVEGIDRLLNGLYIYAQMPEYGRDFGARVYKISRDTQGNRLTYVKVTGGELRVKQILSVTGRNSGPDAVREEKVDQVRIYSGSKYTVVQEAAAGTVCALTGLVSTFCGQGLGTEQGDVVPVTEPVMTYRVGLPEGCDVHQMYDKLCQLEEEEPQLHLVWKEQVGEIHAQLMGEVQIEVLRNLIAERFGTDVFFEEGSIVYKETIIDRVEGVGHFEPLRHYAEVHLILEPGDPGSGLQTDTACSEDELDRNWQRLVLTHLEEREHPGVLTGAPITDMRIILAAGRAHKKHTEGGDFRQATYRAVRQGLCKAQSVLLEPVYAFRLELPLELIGRGMTDMQGRAGKFEAPETEGEYAVLKGTVPVSKMAGYQAQVRAYSGGKGRLYLELKGYAPCHNTEEVIAAIGYEAEHDVENPCGSVFCAHGAGFVVPWDQVEEYMHLESTLHAGRYDSQGETGYGTEQNPEGFWGSVDAEEGLSASQPQAVRYGNLRRERGSGSGTRADVIGQDEIDEIMNRTYGTRERKKQGWARTIRPSGHEVRKTAGVDAGPGSRTDSASQEEYLLVDGYNIIFAWDSLKELARTNLDSARGKLMDILSNFQGYRKMHLILVFDAYKVKGNPGSAVRYHNIDVVYTKEAETADQYIEKVTHEIGRRHHVRVATSDGLEQLIIMGAGAVRVSARELQEEVMAVSEELRQSFIEPPVRDHGRDGNGRNYLLDGASEEVRKYVEQVKADETP